MRPRLRWGNTHWNQWDSLPSTGLYTVVVRDATGPGPGGYKLTLTQTPSSIKPTVTVAAADNLAVEGGPDTGAFTITRTTCAPCR